MLLKHLGYATTSVKSVQARATVAAAVIGCVLEHARLGFHRVQQLALVCRFVSLCAFLNLMCINAGQSQHDAVNNSSYVPEQPCHSFMQC